MKFELITIDPKELEQFKGLKKEFDIEKIEVEDHDQYTNLVELLKKVKTKSKEVKEFFKEPKAEAHKAHRTITGLEKEHLSHLDKFEAVAKDAIGKYLLEIEEMTGQDAKAIVPKVEGISASDLWKWEVEELSKIPSEYFALNEKMINEIVKATNGTFEIPGIRIYKEKSVRVKG